LVNDCGIKQTSINTFNTTRAASLYKIYTEQMLLRIYFDLTGTIASENLNTFGLKRLFPFPIFFILHPWWNFGGPFTDIEWRMVFSVQESYLAEDRIPRPYKKTTLHDINKFTSLLISYGWLREDEANNSTCLGKRAIGTQFLFIGLLSEEAARAWFRP
jgi:hypothetical protein